MNKYTEIFLDRHLPTSLNKKVFNQCVLQAMACGCQTWSPTKTLVNLKQAMQRKMQNVKLKTESVTPPLGKEPE